MKHKLILLLVLLSSQGIAQTTKDSVVSFFEEYLQSKKYKVRLYLQGYENPDNAIKKRIEALRTVRYIEIPWSCSQYTKENHTVTIGYYELSKYNFKYKSVIIHEYSHAIGSLSKIFQNTQYLHLNKKESKQLRKRNKLSKIKKAECDFERWSEIVHDSRPWEAKSDMDILRCELYTDKLYNTGERRFNKKLLRVARERYKENHLIKRFLDNYEDRDIIYLMNKIP